jgi:DNA (cytosine-5)-methyltransferase 1
MNAARKLMVCDLFCGAGGTSTGVAQACRELDLAVELLAINHWETAIATHTKNHPWARHLCANIDTIDPRKVIPGGHLDLLVASPECIFHSVARGGKPINDQSRASAWRVLEWCEKLDVSNVLVENVPEFQNWGPIGASSKRPIKAKIGEIFRHWIGTLRAMNYRVEWKVLNAADFGGATTRKRLFVIARKGTRRIHWPEQSHAKDADKTGDIFKKLKPWRAAREIIDWGIPGESIFTRKRPLARTTLERIAAGLRKFCGAAAEPFLVILRRHMDGKSIDEPVPCLTAGGQQVGIAVPKAMILPQNSSNKARSVEDPAPVITTTSRGIALAEFILQQQSGGAPRSVDQPLPTIAGKGAQAFIVPFFGEAYGQKPRTHDVDEPLPAVTSHGAGAVVEPFILAPLGIGRGNAPRSVKQPTPTILASRGGGHLVQPFVITPGGTNLPGGRPVSQPLPTVMTKDRFAVVTPFVADAGAPVGQGRNQKSVESPVIEPFIFSMEHGKTAKPFVVPTNHGQDYRSHSVEKPMPTVTTVDAWAVVEPHLVKFYRDPKTQNQPVSDPLHTVTTKDRHGLVQPCAGVIGLDIRFRMLRPHELASAMGFEKYIFTGSRQQQVKQIGNAVSVEMARALIRAILE